MSLSEDAKSVRAETSLALLTAVNFFKSAWKIAGTHCIYN